MKSSILNKLEQIKERFDELTHLLSDSEIISQNNLFRDYSKEYAELEPTVFIFNRYLKLLEEQKQAKELLEDIEMRELAEAELSAINENLIQIKSDLQVKLLPVDSKDEKGVYLEIRAGTGGDEAAIFVGDVFRMYSRYIEKMGWSLEVLALNESEKGGFKEIITRINGNNVYAKMKFESGAHRVQRVPETESQGRVHTSAITVAIIPEPDESEQIEINSSDLRIDTYRSSGAGGQHVNTTDSAVRITHIPTGIVVECQEERSQHKNKAKAMSWLSAKLQSKQEEEAHKEISETRKNLVGTGDRSERIRTYNYPQGRLTDHRINLTLYALSDILNGDLDQVINPLQSEYQADLLASLGEK